MSTCRSTARWGGWHSCLRMVCTLWMWATPACTSASEPSSGKLPSSEENPWVKWSRQPPSPTWGWEASAFIGRPEPSTILLGMSLSYRVLHSFMLIGHTTTPSGSYIGPMKGRGSGRGMSTYPYMHYTSSGTLHGWRKIGTGHNISRFIYYMPQRDLYMEDGWLCLYFTMLSLDTHVVERVAGFYDAVIILHIILPPASIRGTEMAILAFYKNIMHSCLLFT